MSQFDKTTEVLGEEAAKAFARTLKAFPKQYSLAMVNGHTRGWDEGRASVKESLARLARAADDYVTFKRDYAAGKFIKGHLWCVEERERLQGKLEYAIAELKACGDWPLESV